MFTKEQAEMMLKKGLIKPETYQKITGAKAYFEGTPKGGVPDPISGVDNSEVESVMPVKPTAAQEIEKLSAPAPIDTSNQDRIDFEKRMLVSSLPGVYANDPEALERKAQENVLQEKELMLKNATAKEERQKQVSEQKLAQDIEYNKKAQALGLPLRNVSQQATPDVNGGAPEGGKGSVVPGNIQMQMAPGMDQYKMPGEDLYNQALKMQYGAMAGKAAGEVKALDTAAKEIEAKRIQSEQVQSNIQKRADELRGQLERGEINPNRVWEESSTGSKIGAVLGMLVAGVGAGYQGRENMAVAQINKAIDRDIDAQKANLNKKSNLLTSYMAQLGDERAAEAAARAHALTVAEVKVKQAAASAQTPEAKAALLMAQGQLEQKRGEYQLMLSERIQDAQLMGMGGGGQGGVPMGAMSYAMKSGKDAPLFVDSPERGRTYKARTPKEAEEMRKVEAEYGHAKGLLNELKQYATLGASLSPTQRERAKTIQEQLPAVLNTINGYTQFTTAHEDYLKELFSKPGVITNLFAPNAKTNQLMQDLDREMELKRAQLYWGYKPITTFKPGVK